MSKKAEERALEAYPQQNDKFYEVIRDCYMEGYNQAEKDIKEAIIKHFKYKQDHSPEHTMHWWVYKNVIDKVNEL